MSLSDPGILNDTRTQEAFATAHGYFEPDMNVVWETVLTALPDLVYRLPSIRDAGRNMSGAPDLPESGDV